MIVNGGRARSAQNPLQSAWLAGQSGESLRSMRAALTANLPKAPEDAGSKAAPLLRQREVRVAAAQRFMQELLGPSHASIFRARPTFPLERVGGVLQRLAECEESGRFPPQSRVVDLVMAEIVQRLNLRDPHQRDLDGFLRILCGPAPASVQGRTWRSVIILGFENVGQRLRAGPVDPKQRVILAQAAGRAWAAWGGEEPEAVQAYRSFVQVQLGCHMAAPVPRAGWERFKAWLRSTPPRLQLVPEVSAALVAGASAHGSRAVEAARRAVAATSVRAVTRHPIAQLGSTQVAHAVNALNNPRASAHGELERAFMRLLEPLKTPDGKGTRSLDPPAFTAVARQLLDDVDSLKGTRENMRPFGAGGYALLRSTGIDGVDAHAWLLLKAEVDRARRSGAVPAWALRSLAFQVARCGPLQADQAATVVDWMFQAMPDGRLVHVDGKADPRAKAEANEWSTAFGGMMGELTRPEGQLPRSTFEQLRQKTLAVQGPMLAFAMDAWVGGLIVHSKECSMARRQEELGPAARRFAQHLQSVLTDLHAVSPERLGLAVLGMLVGFQSQRLCDTKGNEPAKDMQDYALRVLQGLAEARPGSDAVQGHASRAAHAAQRTATAAGRTDRCATEGIHLDASRPVDESDPQFTQLQQLASCFDRTRYDGAMAVERRQT